MPHDYKRALAEMAAAGNGHVVYHDDHAVSTAGEGFVTTESEDEPEQPSDGRAELMGELGAFIKLDRVENPERDPAERVHDFHEFVGTLPVAGLQEQGARCMECGVPFCHNGCPVNNLIPDWNDLVYRDRWQEAIEQLHRTNNFPDFTGRLCPAPCEAACVLEIREGKAVTIKQIELAIVNRGWDEGWIVPQPPARLTGRTVAVIGAGPAGLACAQQLARAGHSVTVYERDEAGGGLVRFGVPDFKIEKTVVERRVEQLAAEGVEFRFGVDVGVDVTADELRARHDAVVIATGARVPRDLPVPGPRARRRPLRDGVPLRPQPLRRARVRPADGGRARAAGEPDHRGRQARDRDRRRRHGRRLRRELAPRGRRVGHPDRARRRAAAPPPGRDHAVAALADEAPHPVRPQGGRPPRLRDLDDEVHRQRQGRGDPLGARTAASRRSSSSREPRRATRPTSCCSRWASSARSRCPSTSWASRRTSARTRRRRPTPRSVDGVFAAGDASRGQSLIVWAINEGRRCAAAVDSYLAAKAQAA